ncbi:MAG: galactose ABC transporter substrate-binding protein [Dorea sp.]|nr:galactose ABC transporter substrate-binding protein [Dorea sp.]
MHAKKIAALCAIFSISIQLLCACGKEQADGLNQIRVGVASYNQSDTFLSGLVECLKESIHSYDEKGYETTVMLRDAASSQRKQDDQLKELVDAGCNVLCVNLVDRSAPSEIIDLAKEYDIPVIFFNREPVAEDIMQWDRLYYVGAPAEQSGVMQGELAAELIHSNPQTDRNRDGKIQYVVLEGEPGHQDAIIRTENAVDTLRSKGIELEKLSYGIANWNRAQAENRMLQMISQYQSKIELVLANNDDMALGAIDAYEKLNYTESALPVFFGIDGTDSALQAVKEGKLAGTVYNDKERQGQVMAKLAVAVVTGERMAEVKFENDRYIYVPYKSGTGHF